MSMRARRRALTTHSQFPIVGKNQLAWVPYARSRGFQRARASSILCQCTLNATLAATLFNACTLLRFRVHALWPTSNPDRWEKSANTDNTVLPSVLAVAIANSLL
jgi:hypothetical protein